MALSRATAVVLVVGVCVAGTVHSAARQTRSTGPQQAVVEQHDRFTPLGFDELQAFIRAYPAAVGTPPAVFAPVSPYWVYKGVAYRGSQVIGNAWTSFGPLTTTSGTHNISGRVSALAIDPNCTTNGRCRLWVGTAGGGVWRSEDAMNTTDVGWKWISQGLATNNIGSLTVDPNDSSGNTIYVGTGETNTPQNSGAGTGLYKSVDGGDTWTRISTMITDPVVQAAPIDFTLTRGISTVVIVPGQPQTMYVATSTAMLGMTAVRGGQSQVTGYPQPRPALYQTTDGGATWTLLWVPPLDPVIPANPNAAVGQGDTMIGVRHVVLDPRHSDIVYAAAWNNGIFRSAPSLEGGDGSFKMVYAIVSRQGFQDLPMFDLTVSQNHTRIYAYNGTLATATQGLYRVDNADVPASQLVTGDGAGASNTAAWISLSSTSMGSPGLTSSAICTSQCFYDLVVAVPPKEPDTVLLAGVGNTLGSTAIRSTDAGVSFQNFSIDAQPTSNVAHSDSRAIVFHPQNADIAFVGSDGGVVRNDGTFTDSSGTCARFTNDPPQCEVGYKNVPNQIYFLNAGLQTLQFFNIAVDPNAPLTRMLGGLQDNSTIWIDGTTSPRVWKTVFGAGDGTSASGFHPTNSSILFASFQSTNFFTNFRNGGSSNWVFTSDPLTNSNERATITASTGRQFISFDQANPDTQFTGFQHVWRTKDNGGPQATLEAGCSTSRKTSSACGDWVPLGVAFPFVSGSTPDSASRQPGDLTSTFFGSDRAGGIIVSAERTPADTGTLWVGTSFGRLFVSKNADAAGPAVTFQRVDTLAVPNRFITRIVVDRVNPNIAYISYSGFNALTPSTPGHVFKATYNVSSQQASFTLLDKDLGDLPINTMAFDDGRGDLYVGTDYGPLVLLNGATSWQAAGVGFPEVLMVDLKFVPTQRLLVAATHGLGIFVLNLPPVGGTTDATKTGARDRLLPASAPRDRRTPR
jgi:hypothetical protein